MTNLNFETQYAVIMCEQAQLESYNPEIAFTSNDLEECIEYAEDNDPETPTKDILIAENVDGQVVNHFTQEEIDMPTYL